MSKHTPEPWAAHRPGALSPTEHNWTITGNASPDPITEARYLFVATVHKTAHPNPMWRQQEENGANAARIVACVDACEGMEDPAAEIERLQAIEGAAKALLNCHTGASWQTREVQDAAFRELSFAMHKSSLEKSPTR